MNTIYTPSILVQDISSHWYVIPYTQESDWNTFCELDEDDCHSWSVPAYAVAVNGSPSRVVFGYWSVK